MAFDGMVSVIVSYVNSLVSANLYLGTFMATFIETMFPPIPSELVLPLAGYLASLAGFGYPGLLGAAISATFGTSAGAVIIYHLSMKLGRSFVVRYGRYMLIDRSKISAAERWFERYGAKAVFLGRMAPGIRELISVPAGFARMEFKRFFTYTFAGSFVWSLLLISVGYFLGGAWKAVPISSITNVLAAVIVISTIAYFIFRRFVKGAVKKRIAGRR